MEPQEAAYVWRDVVGKRWIKCILWQGIITSVVWVVLEFVLDLISRSLDGNDEVTVSLRIPFLWNGLRFALFMVSQWVFLLGLIFISDPQERDAASLGDLASGVVQAVGRAVTGRCDRENFACSAFGLTPELTNRIRTSLDYVGFLTMCACSGALAMVSLLSSVQLWSGRPTALEAGSRGAALGVAYACLQFHRRKVLLSFPVIQRGLFFALKVGLPAALQRSLKLSWVLVLVGEALRGSLLSLGDNYSSDYGRNNSHDHRQAEASSFAWRQSLFATGTLFMAFTWEVVHHMERVIQTEQHVFSPPLGSCEHDTHYTDLLLDVLEEPTADSLVRYHAFHDLCLVSETNVDTWRRAAIFEESGDSYKRVISICLHRLDSLTVRLALCLDGFGGAKGLDVDFDNQLQNTHQLSSHGVKAMGPFRDLQICSWCVRTVASLTAFSRFEDPHGVAQLMGCNVQVVSCLLSCLLVVEVLLGKRSNITDVSFGQSGLRYRFPSRKLSVEHDTRQSQFFKEGTPLHEKAYAMADVLRTSLYLILSVFGSEIVQRGSSLGRLSNAKRDWLSNKKPLFGDREMHLQKLKMFADYRV